MNEINSVYDLICPDCQADLEIYSTEILRDEPNITLKCSGWCPICKQNYYWHEHYKFDFAERLTKC